MNLLTLQEVLDLHNDSIDEHGGSKGVIAGKEGSIEFAIEQPVMGFGDQDTYLTIEEKAAAVGFSLAKGHCFHDGNKRIGFLAMFVFLERNGYTLTADNDEVIAFMLALADNRATREDLVAWVQKYIAPREEDENDVEEGLAPLSFAQRSPLSDEARRIMEDRPLYWRPKVLAQVLLDEMGKCSQEREEHRQGFSSTPKTLLVLSECFPWMGSRLNGRGKIVEAQGRIINLLGTQAFYQSVTGGDLDYMISLARELGGIYRDTIKWSQHFRKVEMPSEFTPLLNAVACYSDDFIGRIENFPQLLLDELSKAEAYEGEGPYSIEINLDFTPGQTDVLDQEITVLGKKLGVLDEHGLSAADHINMALEKIGVTFDHLSQSTLKFLGNHAKWIQLFESLGNRSALIANPQREALRNAIAKNMLSYRAEIRSTYIELEDQANTIERNGRLIGNLIDPLLPESVATTNDNIRSLVELAATLSDLAEEFSDPEKMLDHTNGWSTSIDFARSQLTNTLKDQNLLYERLADSLTYTTEVMKTKLDS